MANNLMLHCGGYEATEDQVFGVPTPDNTATHFPIPHQSLVQTVLNHVERSGFGVENREYGLMNGGAQMFGLFKLRNGTDQDDYGLVIGLRNCHVKMFTAGLCVGSSCFICDNLAFSSEIVIARKHTRWILRDLDRMVSEASGRINQARIKQDERIGVYKDTPLADGDVHDLLVRSVDAKVMANSYIPKVLQEWKGTPAPGV